MCGQEPGHGADLVCHEAICKPACLDHVVPAVNHLSSIRVEGNHPVENVALDFLGALAYLTLNVPPLAHIFDCVDAHPVWLT